MKKSWKIQTQIKNKPKQKLNKMRMTFEFSTKIQ